MCESDAGENECGYCERSHKGDLELELYVLCKTLKVGIELDVHTLNTII